jgi:hypothetical protein
VKGEGLPRVRIRGEGFSLGNNTWVRCLVSTDGISGAIWWGAHSH